jgi:hypothetical protein
MIPGHAVSLDPEKKGSFTGKNRVKEKGRIRFFEGKVGRTSRNGTKDRKTTDLSRVAPARDLESAGRTGSSTDEALFLEGLQMFNRGSRSGKGESIGHLTQGRRIAGSGNVFPEVIEHLFLPAGKGFQNNQVL